MIVLTQIVVMLFVFWSPAVAANHSIIIYDGRYCGIWMLRVFSLLEIKTTL